MKKLFDRRFGLLDAMTLVVASAPILVILRDRFEFHRNFSAPSTYRTVDLGLAVINSLLLSSTLALVLMALRQPRARLRIALRRPGPAACLAASLAVIVMVTRFSIKVYSMQRSMSPHDPFSLNYLYPWIAGEYLRVGFAVIGAWLMLVMVGSWRPEPSWIDRAGRLLGLGWILQTFLFLALPWAESYLPAI
jgi:hypothetical protein